MELFEENVVLASCSPPVARIYLNRPHHQNALNEDLLRALRKEIENVGRNRDVRVLILQSAVSEVFSVGLDVRSMASLGAGAAQEFFALCAETAGLLSSLSVPVIAAVNGFAIGAGLELALLCDLIIAGEASTFGQPEVNFGLIPALGGLSLLRERCPMGMVKRLLLRAEIIDAKEAQRFGLVDQVAPSEMLSEAVNKAAEELSSKAPLSTAMLKRIINEREARPNGAELMEIFQTEDREQGMQAFLKKEIPVFRKK